MFDIRMSFEVVSILSRVFGYRACDGTWSGMLTLKCVCVRFLRMFVTAVANACQAIRQIYSIFGGKDFTKKHPHAILPYIRAQIQMQKALNKKIRHNIHVSICNISLAFSFRAASGFWFISHQFTRMNVSRLKGILWFNFAIIEMNVPIIISFSCKYLVDWLLFFLSLSFYCAAEFLATYTHTLYKYFRHFSADFHSVCRCHCCDSV